MNASSNILGAGLTAVLATGILRGCGGAADAPPAPPPPVVAVESPLEEQVQLFDTYEGRVDAPDFVEIRARVEGFLEEVYFRDGDVVAAGTLLYRIEQGPFVSARDAAKAEVQRLKAALDFAEAQRMRVREAAEQGGASEIEILTVDADRDKAAAALLAGEAQLEIAERQLSYTEIDSPLTGRLSRNQVSVGNLVGAGERTLLTTVLTDDPVDVYFSVDERQVIRWLENVPRGDRDRNPTVRLLLAGGIEYPQTGTIDFGENRIDPDTGTLIVRASFPNEDGRLIPGLFARVRVPQAPLDALTIPLRALLRDQVGPYVLTVDGGGKVERTDVVVGPRTSDRFVIESGLDADDRVIVSGLLRARPGSIVDPKPAEAGGGD